MSGKRECVARNWFIRLLDEQSFEMRMLSRFLTDEEFFPIVDIILFRWKIKQSREDVKDLSNPNFFYAQ